VQQLKVALDQGDAPATSPLGQKFKRFLSKNPDKKKDYDDLKGSRAHQMNQQFRMEWAKLQLQENAIIRESRKDTVMEEYGEEGKYMTFDRPVAQEGGEQNREAVRHAVSYAQKAVEMGPPFIEWNSWKSTTEILVLERVWKNVPRKEFSIEITTQQQDAAQKETPSPAPAVDPHAEPQKAVEAKAKAKAQKTPEPKEAVDRKAELPDGKKKRKGHADDDAMKKLLRKASQLKDLSADVRRSDRHRKEHQHGSELCLGQEPDNSRQVRGLGQHH